jgi:hypothetical protein
MQRWLKDLCGGKNMICMKKKSLFVICISAAVVFAFPNTVHAETINGFTRIDLFVDQGKSPEKWTESGMYQDENGESYWVGKYDAESDRRTVSTGDKLGYADANMNMVIPLTVKWDKWDTIEDFYKGRAMTNDKVQESEASGKWNVYDTKYLIDVNGNEINKVKLKRHYDNYSEKTDTVITSSGDKYYAALAGFDKPKESTGIDVEVIKYSDGSYYNYFYSFADYPFLIDKYKEGEHGNKLMLTDFDETGVAELFCRDTSSWGYHTPIGLGDSGWGYKKNIVLGKISIWGSVFEK